MSTATHTRTHVHVTWADPYQLCSHCGAWVTGWHDANRCVCDSGCWLEPCRHDAEAVSVCPSWSPVDGCRCLAQLGEMPHDEPHPEVVSGDG